MYVIALLILGSILLVGGIQSFSPFSRENMPKYLSAPGNQTASLQDAQTSEKKSLQLWNPMPIVQTPTPSPSSTQTTCDYDSPQENGCVCNQLHQKYELYLTTGAFTKQEYFTDQPEEACSLTNHCPFIKLCEDNGWPSQVTLPQNLVGTKIVDKDGNPASIPIDRITLACDYWKQKLSDGRVWCIGKPVIYLYPTKDTFVNVKLTIPGSLTISIPHISPTSPTGWQNILAHPDGKLEYQGKHYSELYYETAVTKTVKPTTGMVVATRNLQTSLTSLTTRLGLLPNEQKEFMEYWLPKLQTLNSPYIFVSVLTQEQKDSVDHVDITPRPDTFIEMLFVFKPLTTLTTPTPLTLPITPPQRKGFTAVEWGGTIDNN